VFGDIFERNFFSHDATCLKRNLPASTRKANVRLISIKGEFSTFVKVNLRAAGILGGRAARAEFEATYTAERTAEQLIAICEQLA
jgi:hypothetical protein